MFNEKNFLKFKLQAFQIREYFLYRYVYADDANNVMDIRSKLWQLGPIPNATNQIIKILRGSKDKTFRYNHKFELLQYMIKFTGRLYADNPLKTYLGFYDFSLNSITGGSQVNTFLPHIVLHDKIWISDLNMTGNTMYFLQVLDAKLWLAFFIVFSLIGLVSTLGILWLKKFTKREIDHLNWYSIVVAQGVIENTKFISRRFLLITLSIVTIIFHGAFGAFMSSSLAIRYPDVPFSDIRSLLNLPSYTICILPYTIGMSQLENDVAKLRQSAQINSKACPSIFRNYNGTAKLPTSSKMSCNANKLVYIGPGICWFPQIATTCPLSSLPGKYFEKYFSMMMYPGFKYYEQFNQGILRLKSSGHLDYIVKRTDLQESHEECSKRNILSDHDKKIISFTQIRLLLVIILVGILCSIITVIFERIFINLITRI